MSLGLGKTDGTRENSTVIGMCGRVVTTSSHLDLARHLGVEEVREISESVEYNVAPSESLPVVWIESQETASGRTAFRLLGRARWGLVPRWVKQVVTGVRTYNARAETLASKPTYRAAFKQRRCLIPIDGFYEWGPGRIGKKQPWFVYPRDQEPLVLAGLWECWRSPGSDGNELRTCTVITVPASGDLLPVHNRMPAILRPENWSCWLDPDQTRSDVLGAMLQTASEGVLDRHPVDRRVNDSRNNDPALLNKVDDPVDLRPFEQGQLW